MSGLFASSLGARQGQLPHGSCMHVKKAYMTQHLMEHLMELHTSLHQLPLPTTRTRQRVDDTTVAVILNSSSLTLLGA